MNLLLGRKNIFSPFFILFLIVTLCGAYFMWHITSFIKQGVDLVGGTYITLSVQSDVLYNQMLKQAGKNIVKELQEAAIHVDGYAVENAVLIIEGINYKDMANALSIMKATYKDIEFSESNNYIKATIEKHVAQEMNDAAIANNITTLKNRIDPTGAGETLIVRSNNNIIIELPSVQNIEDARNIIGKTAFLAIKPVIDASSNKEELETQYQSLQDDIVICPNENKTVWYVLPQEPTLTGAFLKNAQVGYDPNKGGAPVIQFAFNSAGGAKFKELTRLCMGKQVAISLDDIVLTAPSVEQEIGSEGIIRGNFTLKEAHELALLLKSGSFAAPTIYVEERVIEPTLGQQTVKQGLVACLIGLCLLFIASFGS